SSTATATPAPSQRECLNRTPEVVGSIPISSTTRFRNAKRAAFRRPVILDAVEYLEADHLRFEWVAVHPRAVDRRSSIRPSARDNPNTTWIGQREEAGRR